MNNKLKTGLIIILMVSGGLLCGKGAWIHVKGLVAQVLLKQAWEQTVAQKQSIKPWPWADTWPVARLRSPQYGQDMVVLAGQNGATLAFGPGMLLKASKPGQPGTCILAGHRDTSFSFLQQVQPGDFFILEDTNGTKWKYRVSSTAIRRTENLYLEQLPSSRLALITCYPFNALNPGTQRRYLVLADRV